LDPTRYRCPRPPGLHLAVGSGKRRHVHDAGALRRGRVHDRVHAVLVFPPQFGRVGDTVTGPGFRDDSSFNYNFQVVQTDSREINGASLWITDLDFSPTLMGAVSISVFECELGTPGAGGPGDCVAETQDPRPDLMVERTSDPIIDLIDAQVFDPSQGPGDIFKIRSELATELTGGGSVQLNSYATLFTVVPEPGTAAMLGLGLAGLGVAGRRRERRDGLGEDDSRHGSL
jgi:hypothetical protein